MTGLEVTQDGDGIAEHSFELAVDGERVPGLLWRRPGGAAPGPVVLIGHGRTGHKRHAYQFGLAQQLVSRGWAALALDAPGHGERRPPGAGPDVDWPRPDPVQMAREWQACLEFLRHEGGLAPTVLGYWGVSMGTSLGISLLARESRVRAAVLGLMHPNWPAPPGERVRADAGQVSSAVLFLVNWHDQRVPREQACELFDLIGSTDKRLHAYPGDHGQLPDEAITASVDFLGRYLSGP